MDAYMRRYLRDELNRLDVVTEAIIDHVINIEERTDDSDATLDNDQINEILSLFTEENMMQFISKEAGWVLLNYVINQFNGRNPPRVNSQIDSKYDIKDSEDMERLMASIVKSIKSLDNPSNSIIMSREINQWLAQIPLSRDVHEHVRRLYASIPDMKMKYTAPREYKDLIKEGPPVSDLNQYSVQFYNNLRSYNLAMTRRSSSVPPTTDVPLSEQLLEVDRLDRDSTYGSAFHVVFAGDIPMFAKTSDDIVHEYVVGSILNDYYDQCPFFMYTYGLSAFYSTHDEMGLVRVLDNVSPYMGPEKSTDIGLFQWLNNPIPLHHYMVTGKPHMINEDGKIVEVSIAEGLVEITKAVLATFKYLFHELGFVHGDIHPNNIQLIRTSEPQIIELPGYPGKYFNLDYVPTLIDYGFSTLIKRGIHGETRGVILSPLDYRWATEQQYVMDVDRYIKSVMVYQKAIEESGDSSILSDLINVLFISLSGKIPNTLESSITKTTLEFYLEDYFHRTLAPGVPTYDPDQAIDWFMETRSPNETTITSTTNVFQGNIDDKLQQLIDEKKQIEVYSYPSALILLQDPQYASRIKVMTEDVDSSIERIDCMNEELLESHKFLSKSQRLQYVYRGQVIDLIDEYIDDHFENPTVEYRSAQTPRCSELLRNRIT